MQVTPWSKCDAPGHCIHQLSSRWAVMGVDPECAQYCLPEDFVSNKSQLLWSSDLLGDNSKSPREESHFLMGLDLLS